MDRYHYVGTCYFEPCLLVPLICVNGFLSSSIQAFRSSLMLKFNFTSIKLTLCDLKKKQKDPTIANIAKFGALIQEVVCNGN